MKEIILACSGPSLDPDQVCDSGLEIVAVSTAIRSLYNGSSRIPEYWAFADKLNERHGEEGSEAFLDDRVVKVMPSIRGGGARNIAKDGYDISTSNHELFLYLSNAGMKNWSSSCFAVAWAISKGYEHLIFAGCDLAQPGKWEGVLVTLREYHDKYPDVRLTSWTPESRINDFMEVDLL